MVVKLELENAPFPHSNIYFITLDNSATKELKIRRNA